MNTNFNLSKMRCKTMHWMTETVWEWWCTFTDCNSHLIAKYAVGLTHSGALSCHTLFIGSNDEPNGPN